MCGIFSYLIHSLTKKAHLISQLMISSATNRTICKFPNAAGEILFLIKMSRFELLCQFNVAFHFPWILNPLFLPLSFCLFISTWMWAKNGKNYFYTLQKYQREKETESFFHYFRDIFYTAERIHSNAVRRIYSRLIYYIKSWTYLVSGWAFLYRSGLFGKLFYFWMIAWKVCHWLRHEVCLCQWKNYAGISIRWLDIKKISIIAKKNDQKYKFYKGNIWKNQKKFQGSLFESGFWGEYVCDWRWQRLKNSFNFSNKPCNLIVLPILCWTYFCRKFHSKIKWFLSHAKN